MKPWIDRKRPRHYRDSGSSRAARDDFSTHGGDEIDILYDGYFRGLFAGGDLPNSNGNGRAENGNHRHIRRLHSRGGTRSHVDRNHHSYEISSGRQLVTGRVDPSSSGSLYSSSGSDLASRSYNSTADLGSSDATTAHHEFSSHRDEAGPSERWMRPVPSVSIVAPFSRDAGEQPTLSTGASGGGQTGQLGVGNSVFSGGLRGGRIHQVDTVEDPAQNGRQILRGLKQRLLSFILQGIQNDDTSPACVRHIHLLEISVLYT